MGCLIELVLEVLFEGFLEIMFAIIPKPETKNVKICIYQINFINLPARSKCCAFALRVSAALRSAQDDTRGSDDKLNRLIFGINSSC